MAKSTKKQNQQRRFYRSNLSSIVWDPENNKPLVNFSKKGNLTTDDERIIKILTNLGYPEVPLDAEGPPEGLIVRQPATVIEGNVPIMRSSVASEEQEKIMEKRMKMLTKEVSSGVSPPKLKKPSIIKRRNKK